MSIIRALRHWPVILMFSALVACSSVPKEIETLDTSVLAYERAMRWGEFVIAKSFHKNSPELEDLERRRLKHYRISSYKMINQRTPDLRNAHTVVEIKYYKSTRPVIKTITVKQHWKYDEKTELWYVDSKFPTFK